MNSLKAFIKVFPWIFLIIIVFTLYLTNQWPFTNKEKEYKHVIDSSVILREVENIGRLELVKYNFKEVFEYKKLSDGKIVGNAILKSNSYDPDLSVILVAAGEAVGCIDLTKVLLTDISLMGDTIKVSLPSPELCYYKLDMGNTKIYSFSKESWWSKLFSDESEKNEVLHMAYQEAENRLKEAAIESGIFHSTNENVKVILEPILERLTGKKIIIITSLPEIDLTPGI